MTYSGFSQVNTAFPTPQPTCKPLSSSVICTSALVSEPDMGFVGIVTTGSIDRPLVDTS